MKPDKEQFSSVESVPDEVSQADQHVRNKSKIRRNNSDEEIISLESSCDETELESCTIEVSGVNKNTSHETIKMFFESRKKSGGGKIEEIWYNSRNGNYIITFISREGTFAINMKRNRSTVELMAVLIHKLAFDYRRKVIIIIETAARSKV